MKNKLAGSACTILKKKIHEAANVIDFQTGHQQA
jgi:hypothetical protein